jgi:hypothetical protein
VYVRTRSLGEYLPTKCAFACTKKTKKGATTVPKRSYEHARMLPQYELRKKVGEAFASPLMRILVGSIPRTEADSGAKEVSGHMAENLLPCSGVLSCPLAAVALITPNPENCYRAVTRLPLAIPSEDISSEGYMNTNFGERRYE